MFLKVVTEFIMLYFMPYLTDIYGCFVPFKTLIILNRHFWKCGHNIQGDSGFNTQTLTTYSTSKINPSLLYKLYPGNASFREYRVLKFYEKKEPTWNEKIAVLSTFSESSLSLLSNNLRKHYKI